jgi:hypothetical protein
MSSVRAISAALLCIVVNSCATKNIRQDGVSVRGAMIVERSEIPIPSGYLSTWVEYRISIKNMNTVVFLQYFGDRERIPDVGDICSISYQNGLVEGYAGRENVRLTNANIIKEINCK